MQKNPQKLHGFPDNGRFPHRRHRLQNTPYGDLELQKSHRDSLRSHVHTTSAIFSQDKISHLWAKRKCFRGKGRNASAPNRNANKMARIPTKSFARRIYALGDGASRKRIIVRQGLLLLNVYIFPS